MEARRVTIYGKDACPYTEAARDDFAKRSFDVDYRNVKKDKKALDEMLGLTHGQRRVPVIVEEGRVTVGFGGT